MPRHNLEAQPLAASVLLEHNMTSAYDCPCYINSKEHLFWEIRFLGGTLFWKTMFWASNAFGATEHIMVSRISFALEV